jgi:hypothetical protein
MEGSQQSSRWRQGDRLQRGCRQSQKTSLRLALPWLAGAEWAIFELSKSCKAPHQFFAVG